MILTNLKLPYPLDFDDFMQRRWEHALGNALWHTDSSYKAPRAKYSLLCCHSDPIPGVANTGFCDTRAAYAALPEDVKIALEGLIVEHE